ncbi:hypothetical protein VAWG004_18600 [Aeromonas veronii]|uniref:hypothetical protein n=1 Tax=Aeromonas veronii TaxID=654 RepID=UPI001177DCA1|nr:hypothetical protein [Aeromonas veronii]BEE13357.1 hypothetical protein VAWG004_18600 [Aeromonas veronii]
MERTVIVVRANEGLDKKGIDQMLNQGFAPGFKASLKRISSNITHIIMTNTLNDRAVLAKITHAIPHAHTHQTEQNMDGRIDIYFEGYKEIDPILLYENVEFNNSNPVRYVYKYWE